MTKMTRSRALQTVAGTLAAPFVGGRASAQSVTTLRVGMIPIEPTCLIYYAKENGYFDKLGINVDVAENFSSPAVASAVLGGTYDIGYATMSTLAEAHVKGVPFVIIAADGLIVPGLVIGGIMTAANSTIRTAKDCNGKTFGTSGLNTQSEYAPRAWVDKHGGDSSTIKFVEIPFPQTADALAAGRVDAAYLVEPFITIATKKNHKRASLPPGVSCATRLVSDHVVERSRPGRAGRARRARRADRLLSAATTARSGHRRRVLASLRAAAPRQTLRGRSHPVRLSWSRIRRDRCVRAQPVSATDAFRPVRRSAHIRSWSATRIIWLWMGTRTPDPASIPDFSIFDDPAPGTLTKFDGSRWPRTTN
jgi:ABC-type phosphate/phosphonate transport system substrate-binding protein